MGTLASSEMSSQMSDGLKRNTPDLIFSNKTSCIRQT